MKLTPGFGSVRRWIHSNSLAGKIPRDRYQTFHPFTIFKSKHSASMATTSTQTSFSQALQFITDIKLQELEKQRLAYQARAKVIDEVKALGELETADILNKVFFFSMI
jgi:hypothetical protein